MKDFSDIIDNLNIHLENLFSKLQSSKFHKSVDSIENINGIYVFYENGQPIYVGRTNRKRMKKRIAEHFKPYSNKNSATFAYLLAQEMKNSPSSDIQAYDPDFLKAKERVSRMEIRTIEIDDPIVQTIFEPYAAHKLYTLRYNSFHTQ